MSKHFNSKIKSRHVTWGKPFTLKINIILLEEKEKPNRTSFTKGSYWVIFLFNEVIIPIR